MKSLLFLGLFSLVAITVCHAATITSGSITLGFAGASFDFSGTGFSASGSFGQGAIVGVIQDQLKQPGDKIFIGGIVAGDDFSLFGGSSTIGGVGPLAVNWGGINSARGSRFSVSGPLIVLNHSAGTYSGTFAFQGNLCGTSLPNGGGGSQDPSPCVANLPALDGVGNVDVTIIANGAAGSPGFFLQPTKAVYTFAGPTVLTPEPGNVLLMLPALGIMAMFRRRRSLISE